jgi:hypothetical protein
MTITIQTLIIVGINFETLSLFSILKFTKPQLYFLLLNLPVKSLAQHSWGFLFAG